MTVEYGPGSESRRKRDSERLDRFGSRPGIACDRRPPRPTSLPLRCPAGATVRSDPGHSRRLYARPVSAGGCPRRAAGLRCPRVDSVRAHASADESFSPTEKQPGTRTPHLRESPPPAGREPGIRPASTGPRLNQADRRHLRKVAPYGGNKAAVDRLDTTWNGRVAKR